MAWSGEPYDFPDERYHQPSSLRQSLLNAAASWEADRERERRQHRQTLQSAQAAAHAASRRLSEERELREKAERELKAAHALLSAERAASAALADSLRATRLHALGSWLLLSDVRERVLRLSAAAEAAEGGEGAPREGAEESRLALQGGDDGEGGGAAGGECRAVGACGGGAAGGGGGEEIQRLVEAIGVIPRVVGCDELVEACKAGKTKLVQAAFEPEQFLQDMRTRAEGVLSMTLEAAVSGGHTKLVKLLLDQGANAAASEALHVAVRYGHTGIMAQLIAPEVGASVNARDTAGASPLHIAAQHNQPKAAQFLMRNAAFVDAKDAEGRSALEVAEGLKWRKLVQVLQDPSLLFWNRAGRANKLFKAAEYEPACESYQLAHAEMERMAATTAPPQPDVVATFHFNFARSCQLLGRVVRAIELYDSVLASSPKHARALWRRAECHLSVCNYSAAIADTKLLGHGLNDGLDDAARAAIAILREQAQAQLDLRPREVLGLPPFPAERAKADAEVKKAYRQLCLQHHPDKHVSSSAEAQLRAANRFEQIQQAYEKLSPSPASTRSSYSASHY